MILYVLYNKTGDKYYIGVTDNLKRRLAEHNGKTNHYTGKFDSSWIIKFSKEYVSSADAYEEEKRLKKAKNRKYLEWYISNKGL